MKPYLLLLMVLVLAVGTARAQDRVHGGARVKKEKDKVKMVPRKGDPKKGEEEAEPEEEPGKEPEPAREPEDPFAAALVRLGTWPSGEAREAAASLALLGPEVEPRLIEASKGAPPALAAGICFVLGEVGGDAALPVVQAQAARPDMVPHLPVLFEAIGKLDGLGAVRRVLPFLRHPRRPARDAAELWLRSRLNASHIGRLTAFLEDESPGARLSALRLLQTVAPAEEVAARAFALLPDPAPAVARTAADVLAGIADEETLGRLASAVGGEDPRLSAYAMLALVLNEQKTGVRPYSREVVERLLGVDGLKSPEKLNRGVAAIALADVGYDSEIPEVDALLDREITLVLLNTLGGRTYFKDFSTLSDLARDRFGKLTGIRDRRSIPELWEWWKLSGETFRARRSLVRIDPDRIGVFRVRARSVVEPALPTTLFSNVPGDAGSPEVVGIGYVFLLPDETNELVRAVSKGLLSLPDAGAAGERSVLGPEVVVTVSVENRARTVTGRADAVDAALAEVIALLREIRASHAWQTYWDRDRYPAYEDFVRAESAFLAGNPPKDVRALHMKGLILDALDDLATEEQRVEALDRLLALEVPLEDGEAYKLALFLEREATLTPFSERIVRVLAGTGRPLVVPVLTDWLERNPGPQALKYLVAALTRLGTREVEKAGRSERVVLRRAAMTAGPAVLTGERLQLFLAAGVRDESQWVRIAALSALGNLHEEWALPIVKSALEDEDPAVRSAAVEALGSMGLPGTLPILVKELQTDDMERRSAAVRALCRTGREEALAPILLALSKDPAPSVRAIAGKEIERFGTKALAGLTRIATGTEEDEQVRAQAVGALVRIGGDHVLEILNALVGDPVDAVADAAAWALASRARKAAVPRLLDALDAGRNPIRTVAALEQVSVQSFPSARAEELPAIYRGWWSESQDRPETAWFADALTAKGYEEPKLRLLAMGRLDPNAAPVLIEALGDGDWFVRANANLWLQRITLEDFGEVTRFTSEEDVRAVRDRWRAWWKGR